MFYFIVLCEQIQVLLVMWFLVGFGCNVGLDMVCLCGNVLYWVYSYDNVFYLLLGLFGVSSVVYECDLDVFVGCCVLGLLVVVVMLVKKQCWLMLIVVCNVVCYCVVRVKFRLVYIVVIWVLLYFCGLVCGLFGQILVVVVKCVLVKLVQVLIECDLFQIMFGDCSGRLIRLFLVLVGVMWVMGVIVVIRVFWNLVCGFLLLLIIQKLLGIVLCLNGLLLWV